MSNRLSTIILTSFLLSATACSDSQEVQLVKSGSLGNCPELTVDEMVNSFLVSPSWESGKAEDGEVFVNISGDFSYSGKDVRGMIQFVVDEAAGSFELNAFEMNGVPQPNLTALGLLSKMCEDGLHPGEIASKAGEAIAETSAYAKLVVSELCSVDPSLENLSNDLVGYDYSQYKQSPYIEDIRVAGSCDYASTALVILTTSEKLGVDPFEIVLLSQRNGGEMTWKCATNGDMNHVPKICRNSL